MALLWAALALVGGTQSVAAALRPDLRTVRCLPVARLSGWNVPRIRCWRFQTFDSPQPPCAHGTTTTTRTERRAWTG